MMINLKLIYKILGALLFLESLFMLLCLGIAFIYGEDDPWTGAAIDDPTNPNVQKVIVPHGTHNDYVNQWNIYQGGQAVADKVNAAAKQALGIQ